MPHQKGIKPVAQNRKAWHDYFVEEKYECGIELYGTEVKSMRQGRVNLKESWAVVRNGEVWVDGMHISPYEQGNQFNRDPLRPKRLLLHKAEIRKLQASVMQLPFAAAQFDLVTAFETVYFWPDLPQSFREVYRVLKPGAVFFICNECSGDTGKDDKWTEAIEGMKIYQDVQLKEFLEQTGFCDIQIHKNEKGWLCVSARK